jgi:hypothetical protein
MGIPEVQKYKRNSFRIEGFSSSPRFLILMKTKENNKVFWPGMRKILYLKGDVRDVGSMMDLDNGFG